MSKAHKSFPSYDTRPAQKASVPSSGEPARPDSTTTAPPQTLDQRIASATHVALQASGKQDDKEVRNAIKKAATRVRTAGFGVTMAFALGKKEQHLIVAKAWCAVLKDLGHPQYATPEPALQSWTTADLAQARRITELSERVLEWLAKWADAHKSD